MHSHSQFVSINIVEFVIIIKLSSLVLYKHQVSISVDNFVVGLWLNSLNG